MNKNALLLTAAGALGSMVLYSVAPNFDRSRRKRLKPFEKQYIAHRGLFDNDTECPENSLNAFQRAVDYGYGIEFDVRMTKDKVPIVFHDEDLLRVCGVPYKVSDLTFNEIRRYTLFHSMQKIPRYEDVLNLVGGKVPLVIEIKAEYNVSDICKAVMRGLYCYPGFYCIESFSPIALNWFKEYEPHVLRGQLSMDFFHSDNNVNKPWFVKFAAKNLLGNVLSRPDFISYELDGAKSIPMVLNRKLFETKTAAWTVRNDEELAYAEKYFDMIIFEGFLPGNKEVNKHASF